MKNTHMNYDDRLEIEKGLKSNATLTSIAVIVDKKVGTITNEIKNHRIKKYPSSFNGKRNTCEYFILNKCDKIKSHTYNHDCNEKCSNYKEYICNNLLKKPYVCNGCDKRTTCRNIKMFYYAKESQNSYEEKLSSSRKGPRITDEDITYINNNVVPLVKQGQSFENIIEADNNINVPVCKQSLYNYTENRIIELKNIDLPRKVSYKKRIKTNKVEQNNEDLNKIDSLKLTRNYDCFIEFVNKHKSFNIAEMDTVEGVKGGKLLLTLLFRKSNFMIAILIDNKQANTVNDKLSMLKKQLGTTLFVILFRILLTDNGVEFSMIEEIEKIENQSINLFFCDAGKSCQKGRIEKNHEELRKILPKGHSFDDLTQDDINLIMSHVNSYKRKKLNWKSPIELVEEEYGKEFIQIIGYKKISDVDIILKPYLISKKVQK